MTVDHEQLRERAEGLLAGTTSGPWERDGFGIFASEDVALAEVYDGSVYDADLLAAAPDLAAAVISLVDENTALRGRSEGRRWEHYRTAIDDLRAERDALRERLEAVEGALRGFVRLGKHAACIAIPAAQCAPCTAIDRARAALSPQQETP